MLQPRFSDSPASVLDLPQTILPPVDKAGAPPDWEIALNAKLEELESVIRYTVLPREAQSQILDASHRLAEEGLDRLEDLHNKWVSEADARYAWRLGWTDGRS